MKRLERCKGETSYHKIESDTDGESSPNSGVVVKTSTPKKRSDSEQSRSTEGDKVCQIWEDFDHWISNEFSPPTAVKSRDHDKNAEQISHNTSIIISHDHDAQLASFAQFGTVFGGNEGRIHGPGILCRNPGCVRHSSSCTLLTQSNRNNDDAAQRERGCYSLDIFDQRCPPRSSSNDRPPLLHVSPYLVSIFVLLLTCLFALAMLILWSNRFYENGSTTIQNWWSPRPPNGRTSGG